MLGSLVAVANITIFSGKRHVIGQKFQLIVWEKNSIYMTVHLNILCLVCINIDYTSAKQLLK